MSSASGRSEPSRSASASTVFANNAGGYHVLKIDGYSRIKGIPNGVPIKSSPFSVDGHRWQIYFFPNGDRSTGAGGVAFHLFLDEDVAEPLTARFEFAFMGEGRASFFRNRKRTEEKLWSLPAVVTSFGSRIGRRSSDLLHSLDKYVSKHGSLTVRCDIVVFDNFVAEEQATPTTFVSVPPSDLHRHLGDLLQTEKGADVVFQVGRETFAAHRCMLAARSPVFSAELFGAMKESRTQADVVQVDDMEAPVFKALLCFVYTDSLPEMRQEDEDVMYQHLLVAADRYDMERLKLMCEEKLCEYIDVGNAATILTLAEQHHCHGLKKACFSFLSNPANLKAAMASDGFKHLSRSCPSIKKDLLSMLKNRSLVKFSVFSIATKNHLVVCYQAFDTVSWEYIMELLDKRGFSARWREWLSIIFRSSHSKVLLNGTEGKTIRHARGLRQGDPLSPYLFIMAIDTLHRILELATENGHLSPLRGRHAKLYADDAVVFLNPVKEEVEALFRILDQFGLTTGLGLNIDKCTMAPIRCAGLDLDNVLDGFHGQRVNLPITYLGLPLSLGKLKLVHDQFGLIKNE